MLKFSFLSLITIFLSIAVILALPLPSDSSGTGSNESPKRGPPETPPNEPGPSARGTLYHPGTRIETWKTQTVRKPDGKEVQINRYPKRYERRILDFTPTPEPQDQPSTSQSQERPQGGGGVINRVKNWFKGKFGKGKGKGKQCRFAFRKLQQG